MPRVARHSVTAAAVVFVWAWSSLGRAQTPAPLTFAEALAKAQTQSLAKKRAALELEQAVLERQLVEYDDDARVSAEASWGSAYRETATTRAGEKPDYVVHQQSYGVQAQLPLYDFGRISARRRQLDASRKARDLAQAEVDEALRYAVARAYLAAIGAERIARTAAEQVELAASKLKEQTRNYRQGLRPESDVVTAELDEARATATVGRALNDARQNRIRLVLLMGGDASAAPSQTPNMTFPEASLQLPPPAEWKSVVSAWQTDRVLPADARRAAERESLDASSEAIQAGQRPQIVGSIGAQEVGSWQPIKPQASGQVTLSWDIPWNGMDRDQELDLALRRRVIDLEGETETRGRKERLAIATSALEDSIQLRDVLDRQLALAQRQKKLIQNRYAAGQASALELSSSDTSVLTARLEQVRLEQEAADAALDIAEALGVADLGRLFRQ